MPYPGLNSRWLTPGTGDGMFGVRARLIPPGCTKSQRERRMRFISLLSSYIKSNLLTAPAFAAIDPFC